MESSPTVVWRRPQKSGPRTPLVVLLHGRGADEHDLIDLASDLPRAYLYASIRAPVPAEGGWTWFESERVARPVPESLRDSMTTFRSWLDAPQVAGADRPCYLLGFSAGMMMASALVLDEPSRFAGAVLLSGAIPFVAGIAASEGRLAGVPIFHGHGTLDTVIPQSLVERTETYLRGPSGAVLSECRYPHAHAVSPREILDIAAWFDEHPAREITR